MNLDSQDLRILSALQEDADLSASELARRLDMPMSSLHRRLRALEEARVIRRRVAVLDPEKVGLATVAFISIRTSRHEPDWLARFARNVAAMPEVMEMHRLSGHIDYLLKVAVADIAALDSFYKRLIAIAPLHDVSTSFSMERIKESTALPLTMARR